MCTYSTSFELHPGCWADHHVRMYVTIYNVVHVFVQVAAAKRFVFHLIQAAGHQIVYAVIDHTKKGPIPAPPVELFEVQYTSVRGSGQQQLATLGHS